MVHARWAAIGAAVAVTLGAGGLVSVSANTPESVFVAVTPTRVLDTRSNVGLTGTFRSESARNLDVTGNVPIVNADGTTGTRLVVPDGATAIVANLTAVTPTSRGFVAIRPGTATGIPTTSNLNIPSPGVNVPNSVTVELPTSGPAAGTVDLFFKAATTGATTHLLLDIVGYYVEGSTSPSEGGGDQLAEPLATAVDTSGNVGLGTSVTIGTDGNPVISYHDSTNKDLKVAVCNNPTCTSSTKTTVDSAGNVGEYTSITIGTNGNPVIAYQDTTNGDVKVAVCNNPTCTSSTRTTVDAGGLPSIAIGTNGNPVVGFLDANEVKFAACGNPTCSSVTLRPIDFIGGATSQPSITIGTNGNPIISYQDTGSGALKVATCFDPTCNSRTQPTLETTGSYTFLLATSVAIGINGNPVISYHDTGNGHLKIAVCENLTCTLTTGTLLDAAAVVGTLSSVAVDADGRPIIAYFSPNNGDLKVVTCENPTCTASTTAIIDATGTTGLSPSITIGADGKPVIAYHDATNGDLRLYACGNIRCNPQIRVGR